MKHNLHEKKELLVVNVSDYERWSGGHGVCRWETLVSYFKASNRFHVSHISVNFQRRGCKFEWRHLSGKFAIPSQCPICESDVICLFLSSLWPVLIATKAHKEGEFSRYKNFYLHSCQVLDKSRKDYHHHHLCSTHQQHHYHYYYCLYSLLRFKMSYLLGKHLFK